MAMSIVQSTKASADTRRHDIAPGHSGAEWLLSLSVLAEIQFVSPKAVLWHTFGALPQMWQQHLGITKPVFTLNAHSMLTFHIPHVGRTKQMAFLRELKENGLQVNAYES